MPSIPPNGLSVNSNREPEFFHANITSFAATESFYAACYLLARYLILLLIALFGASQASASADSSTIQKLEEDYRRISTQAYQELAGSSPELKLQRKNIKALLEQIDRADKNGNAGMCAGLVIANMNTIQESIDSEDVQTIVGILLKHHAVGIAEDVLALAKQSYNDYAQARIHFELAKYLAAHHQWSDAYNYLKAIDISTTLSRDDGDEAFIIFGAALQQQKKHRESVEYYSRIKPESIHYRHAQLNTAVAYIRQDWWTDAHIAIKNALKNGPRENDELANRLYTVMGFSQLQHGFYRDARESFRNVSIKSFYANRALLGLGMAALHQEDFIGALNAFAHLKKKDDADISVAESYLLSAFTLVQLKQDKTASASYTEAITYYEQKSAHYDALLKALASGHRQLNDAQRERIHHEAAQDPLLLALARKHNNLQQLLTRPLSNPTTQRLKELTNRIANAHAEVAREILTQKQSAIDSYLSQSRFGLARLYDAQ
jgi:hypothetical protein